MKNLLSHFRLIVAAAIFSALPLAENLGAASTAFVYDTGTEILTTGDFTGDGSADVLVLDKATGNLRVGFFDLGGNLNWSAPLVSGIENVTSCAIGKFLTFTQDSVAVTAPDFNRINLVSLANTNSAANTFIAPVFGVGPHTLVTLDNPFGSPTAQATNLVIATSQNADAAEILERMQVFYGNAITPFSPAQFNESGSFERANALVLNSSNSPSFAAGLVRGQSADHLEVLQFTNNPGGVLFSCTNLPPGGDYAFGNFNDETLPRFTFYQPGASNLTLVSLLAGTNALGFDTSISFALTEPVLRVFYLANTNGTFLVEYADGVQAVTFSGNVPVAGNYFRSGLASAGNVFTGIVPLANGQFVLLDTAAGATSSAHAQVVKFDGTNFTPVSSSFLPAVSSRTTRANVWLFQTEPFVNRDPGFVASFNSPDWSDLVSGLPTSFLIEKESDNGSSTGLGNFVTNSVGPPSAGANFGLQNQVAAGISVFSYAPPHVADSVAITILPAPGIYSAPIQVSFTAPDPGLIFFRTNATATWQAYSSPFTLTNDSAVQYYGLDFTTGAHGRLVAANYTFAYNAGISAGSTVNLTNGLPLTNSVSGGGPGGGATLSQNGTVFYGRKNSGGGSIWAINLDGSGDTYLTTGARPRVSHDGRYLAFKRGTNVFTGGGDVWLRDLTSGLEWKFFTNSAQIIGYDWDYASPPNLILDCGCNFWLAPLSNAPSIFPQTNSCQFEAPTVNSANGSLAFYDAGSNGGIRTTPGGGGLTSHLDPTTPGSRWPAWSPDGSRLAFCYLNNYYAPNGQADLYTINADGTALAQISAFTNISDGFLYGAVWTPSGNGLVGAGSIYGTSGLWLIPLTGDGQHCDCPAKLLPTTAGDPIDFAGSILVAPAPTVAKPGLFIRTDPNAIVVYWSTNYQGFSLQSALTLGASNSWSAISGPYFLNGNYYEYHEALTALAAAKFFRLQYPGLIVLQPLQPKLSLQLDGGQTVLNWSTNYVGYTLEATTNLNPPIIWSPQSGVNVNTNSQFEFRQSLAAPVEFFRLHWE